MSNTPSFVFVRMPHIYSHFLLFVTIIHEIYGLKSSHYVFSILFVIYLLQACHVSTHAARVLSSLGYTVLDYKGGLEEWQEKGNTLVALPSAF